MIGSITLLDEITCLSNTLPKGAYKTEGIYYIGIIRTLLSRSNFEAKKVSNIMQCYQKKKKKILGAVQPM